MVGLPLLGKEGSGTPIFKILVRALRQLYEDASGIHETWAFQYAKSPRINYIIFGHNLCWNLYHLRKKTLRSCLHPGISLIDGNSILIELPYYYFVKAGSILLFSPADT